MLVVESLLELLLVGCCCFLLGGGGSVRVIQGYLVIYPYIHMYTNMKIIPVAAGRRERPRKTDSGSASIHIYTFIYTHIYIKIHTTNN
jgi:hypothetical protein